MKITAIKNNTYKKPSFKAISQPETVGAANSAVRKMMLDYICNNKSISLGKGTNGKDVFFYIFTRFNSEEENALLKILRTHDKNIQQVEDKIAIKNVSLYNKVNL